MVAERDHPKRPVLLEGSTAVTVAALDEMRR